MSDDNIDHMVADRHSELDRQLRKCLKQINSQIEEIRQVAEQNEVPPVKMVNSNGDYIWAPLVTAKAYVLHALVMMDQK